MTKRKYNPTEQRIMRLLYQSKAPLTAYEVAKELNISFPTAKKYLDKLMEEGVLNEGQKEDDTTKKEED